METMERKSKVATVKMERMEGPRGKACHEHAQQGWGKEHSRAGSRARARAGRRCGEAVSWA